jgi:hypothetical protein
VTGPEAAQLAELSTQYQGKGIGEQEYELALALVQIEEETQIPDLGPKDFWVRVREDLVRRVIEQRVAVEATAVVAADQVLRWANSGGIDSVRYEIPLAILTAMVVDSVIRGIRGGERHDGGPTEG